MCITNVAEGGLPPPQLQHHQSSEMEGEMWGQGILHYGIPEPEDMHIPNYEPLPANHPEQVFNQEDEDMARAIEESIKPQGPPGTNEEPQPGNNPPVNHPPPQPQMQHQFSEDDEIQKAIMASLETYGEENEKK